MGKKAILFFGALLTLAAALPAEAGAQSRSDLWEQGNTLYANGDYAGAAEAYESILGQGYSSGRLFYNLGNAYFKDGNIGRAVLNYERAAMLSPYDRDVEYNLAVVNGYVKDRIEPVPQFPVSRWVRQGRSALDSNGWAIVSLCMLALAVAGAIVFVVGERRRLRKAGFVGAVVSLLLCMVSLLFAARQKHELSDPTRGVVMAGSVAVKSSPGDDGNVLFSLHEGTVVEVLGEYGGWREIVIPDGNKGWVPCKAVETVAVGNTCRPAASCE